MSVDRLYRRRRLMSEINVVPYIDVMLVLLIIFMITAPLLMHGVEVNLPRTGGEVLDSNQQVDILTLSIDRDGRFYLNLDDDQEPLDDDRVRVLAAAVLNQNPQTIVRVRADEAVPYGRVMRGLELLREAGAANVGLPVAPPDRN